MDRGEMSFLVTKMTPPDVTETEVTPTAITSVNTSGDETIDLERRGPGIPQEPTNINGRMRLWNQSDIGWNRRNEDDNLWHYWEVTVTEGSTISSPLQCHPSPNIPSCDVPRPTIELKHRISGMSRYKTAEQWGTIWDAQWFEVTDTAWSGHAQPPGRIVFPQRFDDVEWNSLNESHLVTRPKGITSSLVIGSFLMLIFTQASSVTVSGLAQSWKVSRAEYDTASMIPETAIKSRQPTFLFYPDMGREPSQVPNTIAVICSDMSSTSVSVNVFLRRTCRIISVKEWTQLDKRWATKHKEA
jgi:hypothetical protein